MKARNAGRFLAITVSAHQSGASKTRYRRFVRSPWHQPITAKRPYASLRADTSIAIGRGRAAAAPNDAIGFRVKSSKTLRGKRT